MCAATNERMVAVTKINNLDLFEGANVTVLTRKSSINLKAYGLLFVLVSGVGTAMVYPNLLAVIGDVAAPSWRASSVGIYRFWRDSSYAVGAIVSGVLADFFGIYVAIGFAALATFLSGVVVAIRMTETLEKKKGVS